LLNKFSRNTSQINEKVKETLILFTEYFTNNVHNRNDLEVSTLAGMYLLRAKIEKDKLNKLKILLFSLRSVKYYHCTYIKRIFAIFKKDLKMKNEKMLHILSDLGYRLNKLTVFRILQYIFKK
jgi:hypothetical protein